MLPPDRETFKRSTFTITAGYIFHIGLFVTIFLFAPHVLLIKDIVGIGWPSLPSQIVDAFTVVSIIALLAILINRMTNKVLRYLSGPEDYIVWFVTIAPLLTAQQVARFVNAMLDSDYDVLLSVVNEQIECAIDGRPINFTFDRKTNSQELTPVQRVTWSITGWRSRTYIAAHEAGKCATYAGRVGSGFDERLRDELHKQLRSRVRTNPLIAVPSDELRESVWVDPGLYCAVSFLERTESGQFRAPVFQKLLTD